MYKPKLSQIAVAGRNPLFYLVFIFLIGCSSAPQPAGPNMASAPLPSYAPGTTYVYSNGSWETVAAVSPQMITWQNHRGNIYNRYPDFTYRSVNWKTSKRQGNRRFGPFSYYFVNGSNSLWPLKPGNISSFKEMVTSHKIGHAAKSYQVNWTCEVIGTERVAVMAGEFNTWRIDCKRYNDFQDPSKARVREFRTWYYAPELEHYVLTERRYTGRKANRRLELLAVLPPLEKLPDATRDRMNRAFQSALEYKKRGETTAWSVPNTAWSGQIAPTRTFRLADGGFSRQYIQKVNYPDGQRIYPGLAVRNANGKLIVPRR